MSRRNIFQQDMLSAGERFADVFSLPKDVVVNATLLHMVGGCELLVENFKGIISYNCNEIIVKGCGVKFRVCGEGLLIEHYCRDDMKITGRICEVSVIREA